MHASDYDNGNYKGVVNLPINADNVMEIRAVNFENRIRVRNHMRTRSSYNGTKINPMYLENPWIKKTMK